MQEDPKSSDVREMGPLRKSGCAAKPNQSERANLFFGCKFILALPIGRFFSDGLLEVLRTYTRKLALALKVVGLVNLQFAIQRDAQGRSDKDWGEPSEVRANFADSAAASEVRPSAHKA